jgi:hypothetical protein
MVSSTTSRRQTSSTQARASVKNARRARPAAIGPCTATSNSIYNKIFCRRRLRSQKLALHLTRSSFPPETCMLHACRIIRSARSPNSREEKFLMADWNLQIFRFRSRRVETTEFAYDALMYQNYESSTRLRSAPLDYLLSQLEVVLTNWDALLTSSSRFLDSFVSVKSYLAQ